MWGRGECEGTLTGLIENKVSNVKGSVSAEASGAARCERLGLGCRTRTSEEDLLSC